MLPGKVYKPEDLVQVLRKRIWLVLVPWAVVAAVTASVARMLPDRYTSTAFIQYVPPRVPDSMMRPASPSNLTDRLRATEQVILSRTKLEQLIKEFNLYPEAQKTRIMDDIVAGMRRDIRATPTKGDVFQVQYVGSNPVTAMKVTEKIAGFFIEESLKESQRRSEGTSDWVESEVEEKHRQLRELEDKLTKYKMQNAGELPTQAASNQMAVAGLQNQLGQNSQALNTELSRQLVIERQIEDLENQAGPGAAPVPTVTDPSAMTGPASQRLAQARQALEAVKARGVLPNHYDYVRWERLVKQYEKEANAEALTTPVGSGAGLPPAEQARLKQLTSLRADLENLKKQIKDREAEDRRLRGRIAEYQAKVDRSPLRAAELTELERDYGTMKGIYESLLAKREAASMTVNLQRRQMGEQFIMLDRPTVPRRPTSPDRGLINLFGLAGGLALGLALVVLFEYRDSSFKTDTELVDVLSLPVLAVVPLMQSESERKSVFRRRVILNLGLGGAVGVCLAVVAYSFVFMR